MTYYHVDLVYVPPSPMTFCSFPPSPHPQLDLGDCPYMWPYCLTPQFAGRAPLIFNATILNGMGVVGHIVDGPFFEPDTEGSGAEGAKHLEVRFEHSPVLHPWSGWLAIFIRVNESGAAFEGTGTGTVSFTVRSPPGRPRGGGPGTGTDQGGVSVVRAPLRVWIGARPPRHQRVLWDMYHNHKYPTAFIPKDSFEPRADSLDWHGDHPYTNYHDFFEYLVGRKSLSIDLMHGPATCYDMREYGSLFVPDPEEEWMPEEASREETLHRHMRPFHGGNLQLAASARPFALSDIPSSPARPPPPPHRSPSWSRTSRAPSSWVSRCWATGITGTTRSPCGSTTTTRAPGGRPSRGVRG